VSLKLFQCLEERRLQVHHCFPSATYRTARCRFFVSFCAVALAGPRAGINKNENGGPRGPLIERSFIGNQCRESSDHAGFNSWARQPFLFNDASGNPTLIPEPTVLQSNFIMGNYGSSMTQDNDDGSAYYYSTKNVWYGGGHKSNFGGHDKTSDQNLNIYARVYGPVCFRISGTVGPPYVETYKNNTCIIDPTTDGQVYDLSVSIDPSNRTNNDFVTGNNTIYVAGGADAPVAAGKYKTIGDFIASGLDPGTTVNGTQPSNEEIAQWAADLLEVSWQPL
jgi:predicted heme/steroid binding protein